MIIQFSIATISISSILLMMVTALLTQRWLFSGSSIFKNLLISYAVSFLFLAYLCYHTENSLEEIVSKILLCTFVFTSWFYLFLHYLSAGENSLSIRILNEINANKNLTLSNISSLYDSNTVIEKRLRSLEQLEIISINSQKIYFLKNSSHVFILISKAIRLLKLLYVTSQEQDRLLSKLAKG